MTLLFPELLLVVVPLLLVYFWRGRARGLNGSVRLAALAVLTLMAAVPLASIGSRGVDVIAVVDASRSMPPGSRERALEIVRLLDERRGRGDRVGVVVFGRDARIERLPEELGEVSSFVQQVDDEGSDLGAAIGLAASLIPQERPGRILVLSDGEATGESVTAAAHEAAARGLLIDYRAFSRGEGADVAVESLDVPGLVDEREPFQFTASVRSDRTVDAEAVLFRDGVEIARGGRTLQPGRTIFTFRDVIERPGLTRYRLEVATPGDRVPENNAGDAAVRVESPATILLVNATGGPDNLSRAMSAGGLRVVTRAPSDAPRDLAELQAFRAVILENVPAGELGPQALAALGRFTTDLGGGLLVTGGGASFGVGGYFRSALDEHLPVSMELRNEHRKLSLAMVVALDRSGSMAMPAGDGRTKMDLANLGTCAAIETLGAYDEVGVIAVDSAAHVVAPLTSASEKQRICSDVLRIQSMGGGIFTYTALVAAATMVQESDKGTRHIVIFADAADAEEPGEYERLLERLRGIGITVSVIGLGSETDVDADFLKDVAARGNGRILFTGHVDDLPRLFAQEAITVARSSFITEPTPTRALADMVLLGEPPRSFPPVDGYNLTYLRPGATLGAVTTDEYAAPVLAFWHRGLGRIAALTAEVDGQYSRQLTSWPDFASFSVGLGRWLLGGDPPAGVRATIERDVGQGVVRVELDPDRVRTAAGDVRAATAVIVAPGSGGEPGERLPLSWIGDHALEARFPLSRAGVYLGAVDVGGDVLPLAPLTLPYSPEFEPRDTPGEGAATLAEMARLTGGSERTAWDDVFSAGRLRNRRVRDLILPLTLALLLLHVGEIAGRRLLLFPAVSARLRALRLPSMRVPRRRPRAVPASAPAGMPPTGGPPATPERVPEPAVSEPMASALARAKAKARSRLP